jgi:osmoprotectant transport system permease protein
MLRDILLWIQAHPKTFLTTAQQHLALSAVALSAVMSVGGPLGLFLTRRPSAANLAIGIANVLRTIPSLALLVVMLPVLGTGFLPSVVALTLYGLPAVLINTYTGIREVDGDVIEAARGQGLSDGEVLRRIEIPLALPVIFAGVRTAAVQIVSAATLAVFIGGGGLGELISAGMGLLDIPQLLVGALAVAALAILTEGLFGLVEFLLTRSSRARSS